jgi:hypothetical protein
MRSLVWTGAVAIIVVASGAVAGQNRSRPVPAGVITAVISSSPDQAPGRTRPSPAAIVNRVLSFDTNGDDRIARDELPERMEGLVSRGDTNRDGFLTSDEVVALVDTRPTSPRRTNVIVRRPGSIADVIADLKLPPPTHNRALAIVKGPRNVHDPASVDLQAEMRELLDDEDYENFVAAVARLRSTRGSVGGIVGGVAGNPASPPASGQPIANERR